MADDLTVQVGADTAPAAAALADLTRLADRFGQAMTTALRQAALSGRAFDEVLRQLALSLAGLALDHALAPLKGALSALLGGRPFAFAKGGIVPFADGGVIARPTYFPLGDRLGLAGEAGPEAILPLSRGPDGALGVAAAGGGETTIVFNVTTPDVAGFARAEAQLSAMIARAAARGGRQL